MSIRHTFAFLYLSLAIIVSSNCYAMELDRIIAVVDNDVVMQSELESQMRRVMDQLRENNDQMPPQAVLENQVLERLILNKIQLQHAKRNGLQVDDTRLNKTIGQIAKDNGLGIPEFRKILEKDGYSFNAFREDIRSELIVSRLRQQKVERRVVVTDREIDDFLSTQQQQDQEIEYRLAHILIEKPEGASPEEIAATKARAEIVLGRLQAGEDFAELAISASDGQNSFEGGDLGWRKLSAIPSLFSEITEQLQKGHISELIKSPSGFHIIKLIDIRRGESILVEQTHALHILIKTDELTSKEDAEDKLAQLKERLDAGDDFAELARKQSDDRASALKGGDLGWNSPGALVPEFEQVMNSLDPNDISQPFESRFGWHIIQVLERRTHDSTEEVRRNQVRSEIHKRKVDEEYQSWIRQIRDEAYVEIRE